MDTALETIIKIGLGLFDKRSSLLSLWQEIADNFYPERAIFTGDLSLGEDFAANLMTSYPVLARRDMGNQLGAMLRPSSKDWFHMRTNNYDRLDTESIQWLEWATKVQKRAMYDRRALFARATKEGDHDFTAFGQCCLSVELNRHATGLLYRCWHLRDVAWAEDENGEIAMVFRRWKPQVRDINRMWPKTVHPNVKQKLEKDPLEEHEVWHIVVPAEMCAGDSEKYRTPFVSIYVDIANKHQLEKTGSWDTIYVIPRWQTVSGSQYAYSPATVAALPDARLIQAMTRVLLEAGEKAVTPPMIAVQEAIRSDLAVYAGGVTWVDAEYDERLGEVLRPMTNDKSGIPVGMEMTQDTRKMISEAFYLNKLALPPPERDMTAYEVGQRVQEYIRQALPIFEPMEMDYNGTACEMTFDRLLRGGAFGDMRAMPEKLRNAEIQFVFESPLRDATERQKGQRFLEAKSMLADAVALDKSTVYIVDAKKALRDVLHGIGVPTEWTRTEGEVAEIESQQQEALNQQQMLGAMEQGAKITKDLSDAGMTQGGVPVGAPA
ncbi:MAG: hypothetical protein FJ189_00495 [Gammaproteobacteria bacterium]|nr:hypothetical protein [Gammaproteobacteria bacterium]